MSYETLVVASQHRPVDLPSPSMAEVTIKVRSLWSVAAKLILVRIVLICSVMTDMGSLIVVRLIGAVVVIFFSLRLNI